MTNFKVGQKVVCVDNSNWFRVPDKVIYSGFVPSENEIYTIRQANDTGVTIAEGYIGTYRIDGTEAFISTKRFRPLDHQFAEDVIAMICSQPETVEV